MEYTIISLSILIVIFFIYFMMKIDKLEARIKDIQSPLNHTTSMESPLKDELRDLVKEGKDVKAVKKAREAFGLSLLEGKEYIDKLKEEI